MDLPIFGEVMAARHGPDLIRLQHYDLLDAVRPAEQRLIDEWVLTTSRDNGYQAFFTSFPLTYSAIEAASP